MRFAAWLYYLIDRRNGKATRFDRLYRMHRDPFGGEIFAYEQEKSAAVIKLLSGKQYRHILDIGCGSGMLTRMLAPLGKAITAIDFSSEAINHAVSFPKSPSNIEYLCADLRTFTLTPRYDLILCSEVLYYLTPEELEDVARKMSEVFALGTEILTVCKLSNDLIPTVFEKYTKEVERLDRKHTRRPYSIIKFQVQQLPYNAKV